MAAVSFSSSTLPVFVPGGGRRESFDIMQHHKSYAKASDLLSQKGVYLSRGCFPGVQDGADDMLGEDRGIARKGFWLLSPV